MRRKDPVLFIQKFPIFDLVGLNLLRGLFVFVQRNGPLAEEVGKKKKLILSFMYMILDAFVCFLVQALADPYFQGLANVDYEPSRQPISKLEFEFERRKLTRDDVRELMYREVSKSLSEKCHLSF